MQEEIPQTVDESLGTVYPIQFVQVGELSAVPAPVVRLSTCGGMTLEVLQEVVSRDPPQGRYVVVTPHQRRQGSATGLNLLSVLVSLPGHYAAKSWLMERLSRYKSEEDEDETWAGMVRVDNIVTLLRGLLCPPGIAGEKELRKALVSYIPNHFESGPGYQLVGEPLIWLDVDVIEASVKEACLLEQKGQDALPAWERASVLSARGGYLLDERYSDWAESKRREVEGYQRQAVHALHRLYRAYNGDASEEQVLLLLRSYWQAHPMDEDVLRPLLELLGKRGCVQEAEEYYQHLCQELEVAGLTPHPRTQRIIQYVRDGQSTAPHTVAMKKAPTNDKTGRFFHLQDEASAPFSRIVSQGIMLSQRDSGEQGLNHSRRQMISGILTTAYTLLTLSPYMLLQPEKQEPFLATMHETSRLNETIVGDLEEITRKYWKLSGNLSFSLLSGIQGHFQNIMYLLNSPQEPSLHRELLSLASEAAQLFGKTLFDLRDYSLALSYYTFAIKAALEAHNYDLWAVALGRISLLFLSTAQPQQALSCLQEIQSTSIQSQKIRSWCAVVEAEAYSYLHDSSSCLNALERAKDTTEETFLEIDLYATGFTKSRLASYEGSCYLRLNQPESALPALQRAMMLLDPTAVRKRSRLLTYMGKAHILLGDAQKAYFFAHQALDLTQQTQSLDVLYQVQTLNNKLVAHEISPEKRDLNQRIQEMGLVIANARGFDE